MVNADEPGAACVMGRYHEMSTDRVPSGEQWGLWRDTGLHSYDSEFPGGTAPTFAASSRSFITDAAEMCRIDGNGQVILTAILHAECAAAFDYDDGSGLMQPNQIVIRDLACPLSISTGRYHVVNLRLPRSAVANAVGGDPSRLHGRSLPQATLTTLLFRQMRTFAELMPTMSHAARHIGLNAIVDLALGTLRLHSGQGGWEEGIHRSGLWRAACQFIEHNLSDAGLSPKMLAAALRCSRTQVYRLFADHDRTVMGYAQECRLLRSRELLADPECQHSIATIAWLCGFEDPSAFSRSFRRRFACQPREVRRHARSGDSPAELTDTQLGLIM